MAIRRALHLLTKWPFEDDFLLLRVPVVTVLNSYSSIELFMKRCQNVVDELSVRHHKYMHINILHKLFS